MSGLVSVLMNCCNGQEFVVEAIESVLAQTYKNWEIIFWDNASTDDSAKIVQSYPDKRIRYFRGEKTIPLYSARNLALKEVRGEFIAFLDVDDLWTADKLGKQIPLFENKKVGLVFADTLFIKKDREVIKQYYKHRGYKTGSCFKTLLEDYYLSLETVIIRKKTVEGFNPIFDDRFNHIGDADLFRRISYYWELAMINEQ